MSSSPSLRSFDPLAVHYFTAASDSGVSTSPLINSAQMGVPIAAYPTHVLAASTSPPRALPPSQTPPNSHSNSTQPSPIQMQSPHPTRPLTTTSKGFALNGKSGTVKRIKNPIFEPFDLKRPVTPELDAVLKKRTTSQWGQWELEESLRK